MKSAPSLVLASNNRHKAEEYRRILGSWTIGIPGDLGISFDFEENEQTFAANALGKALALHEALAAAGNASPVLADDSGLCVRSLDGAPGVLSNRFGATAEGNLSAEAKNGLLLERMDGATDRSAFFVCAAVLLFSRDRYFLAQEILEGSIADAPRGNGGFGYDPVFLIPRIGSTVAELDPETKDRYSHRGQAGERIRAVLESLAADA